MPVTVTVLVPPAVPQRVTSSLAKPVTASLNTTVKLIGDTAVGSAWAAAWLMVTVGATATATAGLLALSAPTQLVANLGVTV